MDCKEIRNHLVEHDGIKECPLCREHLEKCPSCAEESNFLFELSKGLGEIGGRFVHPSPEIFSERLKKTCSARQRFVHNDWHRQSLFNRSIVAAVVIFLVFFSMLFFIPSQQGSGNHGQNVSMETTHSFVAVNSDYFTILDSIEKTFSIDIVTFPQAKQTVWARNATLFIPDGNACEVASAMARAFDLDMLEIDGKIFIVDRATALLCSDKSQNQQQREVNIDLQFALDPSEYAQIDRIANMMISVDDLKFNAPISKTARIPFFKNDSDVTVLKRPEETFEVRRALPWVMVNPTSGKLEFVAITSEDIDRFNALRNLIRELESKTPKETNSEEILPESLLKETCNLVGVKTVSEMLAKISQQLKIKVIVGTGADISLPVVSFGNVENVLSALDKACLNRPFYFTVLQDGKTILVDEKANLQRYLKIQIMRADKNVSSADLELEIQTRYPQYFNSSDKRSGAVTARFRDYVILRHHSFPLWRMLNDSTIKSKKTEDKLH